MQLNLQLKYYNDKVNKLFLGAHVESFLFTTKCKHRSLYTNEMEAKTERGMKETRLT